ncbi:MAG: hypothetical protein C4297_10535 [Gemmataceae bacterium]
MPDHLRDIGAEKAATPQAERVDLSGSRLGEFLLLRLLGAGGMGQVYLAEQISLHRRVALKILRRDLADNATYRKRFESEARAVARLNHPNIVQVYAIGEESGNLYMALEYVEGKNLKEYLVRKGPPAVPVALSIMRQVASALARAGELGIVHRDIKPENILVTRRGEAKVTDFGLARVLAERQELHLTQTGVTMGTPLYMSPEQVEGRPVDHRSDLYSLGVTCYHLLTGQPPFSGENAFVVALHHVQTQPIALRQLRPEIPEALEAIVLRLMAKRPEDRYQSARELLADLKTVSESQTDPATAAAGYEETEAKIVPVPAPSGAARGWLRRYWPVTLTAAAAAVALCIGMLLGVVLQPEEEPAADDKLENPIVQSVLGTFSEQEAALLKLVELSAEPGRDSEKVRHGTQYRVDLLVLYLRSRGILPDALQRAERFCQEQMHSKVEAYASVGLLGYALVLAFRDRPEESNQAFEKWMQSIHRFSPLFVRIMESVELRRLVRLAIEYNERNGQAQGVTVPESVRQLSRQMLGPGGRIRPGPAETRPPLPPGSRDAPGKSSEKKPAPRQ